MVGETGAAISVTIFVLTTTIALYLLPVFIKQFSKDDIANMVIKRCFFILATFLMTLNASIMATLADTAGIALTTEIFLYMWLFMWAGYIMIIWLFFKTIMDVLKQWRTKRYNTRMGANE